jgi:hypothetical protein
LAKFKSRERFEISVFLRSRRTSIIFSNGLHMETADLLQESRHGIKLDAVKGGHRTNSSEEPDLEIPT